MSIKKFVLKFCQIQIILLCYHSLIEGCLPGLQNLQYQLKLLQEKLGGDIEVDLSLTSIPLIKYRIATSPNPFIAQSCDLNCYSFDAIGTTPCKWSNEVNEPCAPNCGDSLDFIRAKKFLGNKRIIINIWY